MRHLILILIASAVLTVGTSPAHAAVTYQVFTDLAAFQAAVGTSTTVTFDDIDTSATDPATFTPNRYKLSQGVRIEGEDGQFVSRDFGFPEDFVPHSGVNTYAPGPIGDALGEGGNLTFVDFFSGVVPAQVAGVGVFFIDPDFPGDGPSSQTVLDASGNMLQTSGIVSGTNAEAVFRGIVALDNGTPVATIFEAQIVNGQGWPGVAANEGVTLDDLTFGLPTPAPGNVGEICDNGVDDDGDGFVDRLDSECRPPAAFQGLGVDNPTTAKAIVKCQKGTEKAGTKFVAGKLKHLDKCLQVVRKCVQEKPGDQDCITKASATCDTEIDKIGAEEGKVTAAVGKACAGFGTVEIQQGRALGYYAEVADCNDLGVASLTTPAAVAACIIRQHECAVEKALTIAVPRASEFLTLAGHTPGSEFPCLGAGANGGGQGLGAAKGKALGKCDQTIQKVGVKLFAEIAKVEQKCGDAAAVCVQTKPDDARCIPKARDKCAKTIIKLTDVNSGTLVKLVTKVVKPCTSPVFTPFDLVSAQGLGFLAVGARCTELGFPPTSVENLITCLGLEHIVRATQMLDKETPRLREFGSLLDVALPQVAQ
jgi:hypothetical protein